MTSQQWKQWHRLQQQCSSSRSATKRGAVNLSIYQTHVDQEEHKSVELWRLHVQTTVSLIWTTDIFTHWLCDSVRELSINSNNALKVQRSSDSIPVFLCQQSVRWHRACCKEKVLFPSSYTNQHVNKGSNACEHEQWNYVQFHMTVQQSTPSPVGSARMLVVLLLKQTSIRLKENNSYCNLDLFIFFL